MKPILLIFILLLFACSGKKAPDPNAVYICTGSYAKAYHTSKECDGLSNCKKEVKTVTLQEAEKMKRHGCHYCVKP